MTGRLYDPVIGRFVTPDPYVTDPLSPQGLNRYSYVQNDPMNFVDPSGFQMEGGGPYPEPSPGSPESPQIDYGSFPTSFDASGFYTSDLGSGTGRMESVSSGGESEMARARAESHRFSEGGMGQTAAQASMAQELKEMRQGMDAALAAAARDTGFRGPTLGEPSPRLAKDAELFSSDDLRPSHPALDREGFGFPYQNETCPGGPIPVPLPDFFVQELQPLFAPYGIDLSDIGVVVLDLPDHQYAVYAGDFGENTIGLKRSRLFSDHASIEQVLADLAHEIGHIWQARLLGGYESLAEMHAVEREAYGGSQLGMSYVPPCLSGLLPNPGILPGVVSLEAMANLFAVVAVEHYSASP